MVAGCGPAAFGAARLRLRYAVAAAEALAGTELRQKRRDRAGVNAITSSTVSREAEGVHDERTIVGHLHMCPRRARHQRERTRPKLSFGAGSDHCPVREGRIG